LEERQKVFFANCRKMKPADREEEFQKIKKEYAQVRRI
jgi:ribosomal protein L29